MLKRLSKAAARFPIQLAGCKISSRPTTTRSVPSRTRTCGLRAGLRQLLVLGSNALLDRSGDELEQELSPPGVARRWRRRCTSLSMKEGVDKVSSRRWGERGLNCLMSFSSTECTLCPVVWLRGVELHGSTSLS